jgi:Kef-type K+ transport system membrane component KefB
LGATVSHTSEVVAIDMALIIIVARMMGNLARRAGQPAVVGEIIGGMILGPSLLGALPGHLDLHLIPLATRPFLQVFADIGVVLFMFMVGLEVDLGLIKGRSKLVTSVSLTSIALPFGLGIGLAALLLYDTYGTVGHRVVDQVPFALFIGASMSITALPVLARILEDRGMHRTPVGALVLACAAVDDLMAWSLLAVVIGVVESKSALDLPTTFVEAVAFVCAMLLVVRPLLRRITGQARPGRVVPMGQLSVILAGLLVSAWTTDKIGIHMIFGAFLFGLALPKQGNEKLIAEIVDRIEGMAVILLLPIFFMMTGLSVNIRTIGVRQLGDLAAILAVAIGGKFLGAFGAARVQGLSLRQSATIGTLMNTRGLTELIILNVGLQLGVLNPQLFTLLVLMALITTIMTAPLLRITYPDRMLQADLAAVEGPSRRRRRP